MNKLYNNRFIELLEERINKGEFSTKEELIAYLKNYNSTILKDPVLLQRLRQEGIVFNHEDLNQITTQLLTYYDKSKTVPTSLNLDGVSQVSIDNKEYIKVKKEDGTHEILDNNMTDKNFVQQFQDRQNSSYDYQSPDGIKNKTEIIEDLKKEKETASLQSSVNVNTRDLTPEERRQFSAVMHLNNADEINFVVDPVRNIYINKNTGELFYVHKNDEGKMEVRKAEEKTSETFKEEVEYVDEQNKPVTAQVETPIETEFENMDEYELQYIANNRLDALTPEQKATLFRLLERKKETIIPEAKEKEHGKQYVLLNNVVNKQYNGFSSVIFLSLVTLICGIGLTLYMFMMIK